MHDQPINTRAGVPRAVLVCALVLLSSGLVQGLWTQRWSQAPTVSGAAALARVPVQVGQWVGTDLPALEHSAALNSLHRQYVNRVTNRTINVILIAGSPRAVSNYPIARLFADRGYRPTGDAVAVDVWAAHDGSDSRVLHGFLRTDYHEPASLKTEELIALSAWTEAGTWESPGQPEQRFSGSQQVYRLYVTQAWDFTTQSRPHDVHDFLAIGVPQFSAAIVGDPVQSDSVGGAQR